MQTFSSLVNGRYTRRMAALLAVAAITAGFVVAAKAQSPAAPQLDTPLHIVGDKHALKLGVPVPTSTFSIFQPTNASAPARPSADLHRS